MKLNTNKILYSLNFLMSLGYNAVSKILPASLTHLTSSALQISLISTAYNIGKIISGVAGGVVADKLGKKRLLSLATLFIGLFSLSLILGNTIEWFVRIFFMLGIFSSLFYLSLNSIATITNKQKGEALSKLEVTYQVGFIIGPFLGGALALVYGMHVLFVLWAVLMLAGFVITPSIDFTDSKSSFKSLANKYFDAIKRDPVNFFLLIMLGTIFMGVSEGARDILIPLYATDIGLNILLVGTIFTISSIVTMAGIVPLGKIADKFGRRRVFLFSFLAIGVAFLLVGFYKNIIILGVLTGVISLGRTAGLMGARASASDMSNAETRATSLAIVEFALSVGRIIGALAAGFLKDTIFTLVTLKVFFWVSIILAVFYLVIFLVKKNKLKVVE